MRLFNQLPARKRRYAINLWQHVGVEEGTQGTPDQVLKFLRLCEDDEVSAFYIENIMELAHAGNGCMAFNHDREIERLRTEARNLIMEKQNGR